MKDNIHTYNVYKDTDSKLHCSKANIYSSTQNLSSTMLVWTVTQCFSHIKSYTTPNKSRLVPCKR
jgi:hypothetical protein